MQKLDPAVIEILKNGTKDQRLYIFEQEPAYFGIYYFPKQFKFAIPPFHFEMDEDYKALMDGRAWAAMWKIFRDSAKTTKVKIQNIHAICYRKKRFIRWVTEDGDNSEQALFDITVALQTNKKLIADFGNLYNEPVDKAKKTKKKVTQFITTNGVKMEALTARTSGRGAVQDAEESQRPDWLIFDDFETENTVLSVAETNRIQKTMEGMIGGLANNGSVSFLCNGISESGTVAHFESILKDDPRAIVRDIPVENPVTGELAWQAKFTHTDAEAQEFNAKEPDQTKWKVSLETKKRQLTNYQGEMMNNPISSTELLFDRARVQQQIEIAKSLPVVDTVGEFKLYRRYKTGHIYALGGDAGTGAGKDHSATAAIDFTPIPVEVIGSFNSNLADATELAHVMFDTGKHLGRCALNPERNYPGNQTVEKLVELGYENIFIATDTTKIKPYQRKEYGFQTNKSSRRSAFLAYRKDFNEGLVSVLDPDVLQEMLTFTWADLYNMDKDTTESLVTKHYDLLMSTVIGYSTREFAEANYTPEYGGLTSQSMTNAIENPM